MSKNWNFTKRDKSQPIEFDGGADEICEGCTVNLEQNGVGIVVHVNGAKGNTWTGQITGFDNEAETMGELKIGTKIQFEDNHVFRCAA